MASFLKDFFKPRGGFLAGRERTFRSHLFKSLGSDPRLLLDLDFREPNQQAFPTTATGVISGRTASAIWLCDEASGNLVDEVASNALVPTGSGYVHDRKAVGFYDGTDCQSKAAAEVFGTGRFVHGSSSFADLGTGDSFAILMVARKVGTLASKKFTQKLNTKGWSLATLAAGAVRLALGDGTASAIHDSGNGAVADEWQAFIAYRDTSAGKLRVLSTAVAATAETTDTTGDMSDATAYFTLGSPDSNTVQIAYVATFEGAEAEGLTQADLDAFWTHAQQYTTPELDTYTRASLACPEVGNESGFGVRVAKFGSGDFAYGYNSSFSHASKLGALIEQGKTNLLAKSEEFSAWTLTNAAVVDNDAEAPDGSKTADKLTASADNGRAIKSATTTASAQYTGSVYIKRAGAGDVTGKLILHDGSLEVTNTAFTATSEWQRVSVSGTHAGTTTQLRVQIDTNTEAVHVWGAQLEAGYLTSYIPTGAASATRAATEVRMDNTSGSYYKVVAGEVEVGCAYFVNYAANNIYFSADNGAGATQNQMRIGFVSTVNAQIRPYDSTGTAAVTCNAPASLVGESIVRYRWNSLEPLAGYARHVDVVSEAGPGAAVERLTPWTSAETVTRLTFGTRYDLLATTYADAVYSRFRIWDGPRPD